MNISLDKNQGFNKNFSFFILNAMDDWVRIIDDRGKISFINDALKRALDQSPTLKGYLDGNIDLLMTSNNDLIKNSTMVEEKLIDGRYYSIKTSPIFLEDIFTGTIEVYRDITRESILKIDLYNANKAMVDDVRFVRHLQEGILPKNMDYGRINLSAIYRPSDKLSGDIYDLIRINEEKMAFYIADVMGHGVKASTMTMFLKATMNAIFDKHPDYFPSSALLNLRNKFTKLGIDSSQYLTAWLGIFDFKENRLTFSNAGHNCPPLILKKESFDANYLLVNGRMISNIIEPDTYDERSVNLDNGDKILFFTDGAIEAKDENQNEFGLSRLKESFSKSRDIYQLDRIIKEFSWQQLDDDLTLAMIEYK